MSIKFPPARIGAAALAIAAGLALAACSAPLPGGTESATESTKADGPVKLGLLAPLTGASAADGKLMRQGAELALRELNAAGGVAGREITLEAADVKDLKSDAVASAVSRLTADGEVGAVITGYASTTNFEIDLLAEAGVPYLIGGGSTQTAEIITKDPGRYPGVWSTAPHFEAYKTDLPERLEAWSRDGTFQPRTRTVYIISSDNPYSNDISDGLVRNFTAKGWKVVGPDVVPYGEVNDWTPQIGKIHAADPSVIVNLDYLTANAVKFLTQFRDNPTDSLLFSQYAPSVPEFKKLAGRGADGVLYNLPVGAVVSDRYAPGRDFVKKFNDAYGTDPGLYGVMGYEQVRLWAKAAESVGDPLDRAAVGKAVGGVEMRETAMGTIRFDQATHLAVADDTDGLPLQFFQIQDGRDVLLGPAKYADGTFELPDWFR
ncbi:ABC transporter substrate-binding protein [Streptosporangium sp. NPDC020072]|uniref:ABC transporter substrate-binding protein n=1 Tax=Streptosporangium sp. NPDC020072 TaxID=3154788 RepID=UPI0034327336